MAKKKDVVPVFVDNVEALEAKMQAMREAQKIFATYTQEQVDKIFFMRQQLQRTKCVFHLQSRQLRKPDVVLLRIK